MLDDCIKCAIAKIFKVRDDDNINVIIPIGLCDLPYIGETIACRRLEFVNNVLDIPYLTCLFPL